MKVQRAGTDMPSGVIFTFVIMVVTLNYYGDKLVGSNIRCCTPGVVWQDAALKIESNGQDVL